MTIFVVLLLIRFSVVLTVVCVHSLDQTNQIKWLWWSCEQADNKRQKNNVFLFVTLHFVKNKSKTEHRLCNCLLSFLLNGTRNVHWPQAHMHLPIFSLIFDWIRLIIILNVYAIRCITFLLERRQAPEKITTAYLLFSNLLTFYVKQFFSLFNLLLSDTNEWFSLLESATYRHCNTFFHFPLLHISSHCISMRNYKSFFPIYNACILRLFIYGKLKGLLLAVQST